MAMIFLSPNLTPDEKLERISDCINMLHTSQMDVNRALVALATAISKQPCIDKEVLLADYLDSAAISILAAKKEPDANNPMVATLGYYLHQSLKHDSDPPR